MIKEISYLSACYNPGADLWVVPSSPNSSWYKKLNWYCSSQLSVWTYKKKPSFSNKLNEIISDETLPFTDKINDSGQDILVDTINIFPNRAVLAIDVSNGLYTWLDDLTKKSEQLNTNKIRIFWGQNQIQDLQRGLNEYRAKLSDLSLEIVTCEPDKL
jgi:hypothetical protein